MSPFTPQTLTMFVGCNYGLHMDLGYYYVGTYYHNKSLGPNQYVWIIKSKGYIVLWLLVALAYQAKLLNHNHFIKFTKKKFLSFTQNM